MDNYSIFVSIACFMDKDILNTIEDCLQKAKNPQNITFGICLQYDPEDYFLKKYDNNPQFKIHKMHWKEAIGAAYARTIIYKLYSNEDYFFQIDCHTRFFNDWDINSIFCLNECKKINKKSIISYYPININNMFNSTMLKNITNISIVRCIDNVHGIKTHGKHVHITTCPKKSWGISAAMLFFDKETYHEVIFDTNIFYGLQFEEQVVLAARYWTHGYDIFTPSRHIISTEYITNKKRYNVKLSINYKKKKETYDKLCHIMKLCYNKNYLHCVGSALGNKRTIEDYYKMLNIYDKIKHVFPDNYLDLSENMYNTIVIGSEGNGYIFSKYFINYILTLTYPNKQIIFKNTNECNLIIFTNFTWLEELWNTQKKPYIIWNGESYNLLSKLKYCSNKLIFSSVNNEGDISVPYAFHAYIEYVERNLWLKYKFNIPILQRKKLFGYCISNKDKTSRINFIEEFTKYTTDTYAFGKYKHKKSIYEKVGEKWNSEQLQLKYSEFKFILAAENRSKYGYLTEKIINVFSSGAIPIYIGDVDYAKKIFNHNSFICVDDFKNYEECIEYIINLSDEQINSYYNSSIFSNNIESEIFRKIYDTECSINKNIVTRIKKLMDNNFIIQKNDNNVPAVLINLKKDYIKLKNMTEKLNKLNIPFTRFNAIVGHDIYDDFKNKKKFINNGYNLRPPQIGIWQSHLIIWKQMIEQNIDKLLIFEDDCSFVWDFTKKYNKILDMVKDKEYDILFIGYCGASINAEKDLHIVNHGCPRATHAYILSQTGAKKLVEKLAIIDYPIDEIIGKLFNKKKLNGFRTSYLLCYQPWQKNYKYFPDNLTYLINKLKNIDFIKIPKYYINLDKQNDHSNIIKKNIKSLSNLEKISAYDSKEIKDLDNLPLNVIITNTQKQNIIKNLPTRGGMLSYERLRCVLSHRKILDIIIKNNYEDTLVLEDDINFINDFDNKIIDFKIPTDYDIFFIGYHSCPHAIPYNEKLHKCHRIYGTFGMIISLKGAKKIVNELKIFNPLKYALDTAYYFQIPSNKINKYCLKKKYKLINHLSHNTKEKTT